jgi:hypothetical protein
VAHQKHSARAVGSTPVPDSSIAARAAAASRSTARQIVERPCAIARRVFDQGPPRPLRTAERWRDALGIVRVARTRSPALDRQIHGAHDVRDVAGDGVHRTCAGRIRQAREENANPALVVASA